MGRDLSPEDFCRRCDRAHIKSVGPDTIADRRELERFPVTRSVELTTTQPGDSFEATIVDFTERGLRILTARQLADGERLTVQWGQRQLVGTVIYCQLGARGFLVGISVAAGQ